MEAQAREEELENEANRLNEEGYNLEQNTIPDLQDELDMVRTNLTHLKNEYKESTKWVGTIEPDPSIPKQLNLVKRLLRKKRNLKRPEIKWNNF